MEWNLPQTDIVYRGGGKSQTFATCNSQWPAMSNPVIISEIVVTFHDEMQTHFKKADSERQQKYSDDYIIGRSDCLCDQKNRWIITGIKHQSINMHNQILRVWDNKLA